MHATKYPCIKSTLKANSSLALLALTARIGIKHRLIDVIPDVT